MPDAHLSLMMGNAMAGDIRSLILSIIEMSLYVFKDVANEELFVLVKSLDEVVVVVSDRMLLSIR